MRSARHMVQRSNADSAGLKHAGKFREYIADGIHEYIADIEVQPRARRRATRRQARRS